MLLLHIPEMVDWDSLKKVRKWPSHQILYATDLGESEDDDVDESDGDDSTWIDLDWATKLMNRNKKAAIAVKMLAVFFIMEQKYFTRMQI